MSSSDINIHAALKDLACSEIGPDLGNLVKYYLFFCMAFFVAVEGRNE